MKIFKEYSLGKFFTFEKSKDLPIYRWFYYKEAFSPQIVYHYLDYFNIHSGTVLDPFAGIGTTLLACKERNIFSIGIDSNPLAVFISTVKTRNYSNSEIDELKRFASNLDFCSNPSLEWKFELFDPKKAFPPKNYNLILSLREKIENIENEKVKNLALLALLSILPMCSFIVKDGGVLKIKKKNVGNAKDLFKRKIKEIISDLSFQQIGPEPLIFEDDARIFSLDEASVDLVITSPPYLNGVDYTKVYGLELSLLTLREESTKKARANSLRSFVFSPQHGEEIPLEVGDIGFKIPIVGAYFTDMEKVLLNIYKCLKPSSYAVFIVSNAFIFNTEIFVDEILASIAERIGFSAEIVIGLTRVTRIKHFRLSSRESAIILKKIN